MKVTAWEIFGPWLSISKTYTWVQCKCNRTAWTWPQCQLNSWELLYDESQIRTQNAVKDKIGDSLKTMGQTRSKHQQAQRFKSHVCKSQKKGWNILSYYNRDRKKHKRKITRSILKRCKNIKIGLAFSTYWKHNSAVQGWKSIIPASLPIGQSAGITITYL